MKYFSIIMERYLEKEGRNNEIFQEKSGKVSGEGGKCRRSGSSFSGY